MPVLIILFVIALVILGPLLTIWALNTLFPVLHIDYGVAEWFAVLLLGAFLRGNVSVNK